MGAGIGAAIGGLGSIAGGIIGGNAQSKAAQQQSQAEMWSVLLQAQMYANTQKNIQPWIAGGQGAQAQIAQLTGTGPGGNPLTAALTSPFQPTMEQLAQTPGYQFTLDQGLKAVQNNAAAKGLSVSGPAIKGAVDYAEGLASTTYQQQFQNYWGQNQNIYNMLTGQSQLGANAALGLGSQGVQVGNNIGNAIQNAGTAQAAGTIGSTNAMLGGINNAIGWGNYGGNNSLFSSGSNYFSNLFGGSGGMSTANTAALYPGSGLEQPSALYLNPLG